MIKIKNLTYFYILYSFNRITDKGLVGFKGFFES